MQTIDHGQPGEHLATVDPAVRREVIEMERRHREDGADLPDPGPRRIGTALASALSRFFRGTA